MAKIEIKVTLADETEIVISQPVTAERRGEDASIPSIGVALLGSAVPSMVRALGLRTQQDEAEIMEQVAARASEMVQQVREAEAAEAAAAEQDAQVEADLDKHKPEIQISAELTPEAVKETAAKAIDRAGKQHRR